MIPSESPEHNCPYIRTRSGKRFPVSDCKVNDIDILDIASGLSKQPRFGGQTCEFYSVARHSIIASYLVSGKRFQLSALLHDASEAYICDIPRPFKSILGAYHDVEVHIQSTIYAAFGIGPVIPRAVKWIDWELLRAEFLHFFPEHYNEDFAGEPIALDILATTFSSSPKQDEEDFISRYLELKGT